MPRISDANYHLPRVLAIQPHRELTDSANRPMVLTCVDTTSGDRGDYVVKLIDSERMGSPDAHMRETMAAFMAMEMEIPTPAPAVVEITPDLVETARGHWSYSRLSRSVGICFGCQLLDKAPEFTAIMDLNPAQKPDAKLVLPFDALLKNFDRRAHKPNLLSDGERLYVIDHELAFGFLFEILPDKTPWTLHEADVKQLQNHLLYTKLRNTALDVDDLCSRLDRINDAFWDKAMGELPETWRHEQYRRIRDQITSVKAHSRTFYEQLNQHLP